jgi:hypothetical protein
MGNNENNQKEKKRVIPFFWWFGGALLTGGLVTMAILYGNRNKEVKGLEQKLQETETTLTGENEKLTGELTSAKNEYDTLFGSYQALNNDLAAARSANGRLAAQNKANMEYVTKYKEENSRLQESLNNSIAENDRNNKMILTLNDQISDLQSDLTESQAAGNEQGTVIMDQKARMAADSAALAQAAAQQAYEDVKGYINITQLNGAYGLYQRDIPNSHYFYGISMMNGYVINRRWITGVGVAVSKFNTDLLVPVYLGFRYNFQETGLIPYFSFNGGLEFNFDDIAQPFLFVSPGLGLYKSISDKFAVDFGTDLYIHRDVEKSSFINFRIGLAYKPKKMLR